MTVQIPDPATEDCRAITSILARVGDKWTVLIVVLLGDGPKRFNEIRRMVGGISQRMLTFTLRGLERDGLVTRTRLSHHPAARGLRIDQARQHFVAGRGTARFVGAGSCERNPQIAEAVLTIRARAKRQYWPGRADGGSPVRAGGAGAHCVHLVDQHVRPQSGSQLPRSD